jgi:hypothetical protein
MNINNREELVKYRFQLEVTCKQKLKTDEAKWDINRRLQTGM